MSKIIEKELFSFDVLCEESKQYAIEKYREILSNDDFEYNHDDFENVAKIIGIEFDTTNVELYGGGTRKKPKIYYSGFSSQGDGLSYEGVYYYQKGSLTKIKKYAPLDNGLYEIVENLQKLQRKNFYRLEATFDRSGHYYHSNTMRFNVTRSDDVEISKKTEEILSQLLREFAEWMYSKLEENYNYVNSDEYIIETIQINEYEFDSTGIII